MDLTLAFVAFPQWLRPEVIPGLPIRWYGVMYLVAFALTYLLTVAQLRRPPSSRRLAELTPAVTSEDVANLFFWTIIGLVAGSRVLATTVYDTTGYYRGRPWLIFWPFDEEMNFTGLQGMSFHGGLIGSVIAFLLYCRIRRIPALAIGDLVVTAVPIGYTFGRLGNFINGELYGRISAAPWAVLFPNAAPVPADHPAVQRVAEASGIAAPPGAFINVPRHPSQIYEALLEGVVLWAILWFVFRPRRRYPGMMVALYLIGYSAMRFIAEYFRTPDPGLDFVVTLGAADNPRWLLLSPFNLTTGQLLSIGMGVAGGILLLVLRLVDRHRPRVETFEDSEAKSDTTTVLPPEETAEPAPPPSHSDPDQTE